MWQGCHRKAKKRKCDRQMPCLCAKEVALRTSVQLSVECSLRGRPTFLSFCPPAKGIRISLSQLKEAPQKPQVRFPEEMKNPWMFRKSKRRGRKQLSEVDRKASMMNRMEGESQQTANRSKERRLHRCFSKKVKELAVCFLSLFSPKHQRLLTQRRKGWSRNHRRRDHH